MEKKQHAALASAYMNPHPGGRGESFERKHGASVAILRRNLSSVNIKVDRTGGVGFSRKTMLAELVFRVEYDKITLRLHVLFYCSF